MKYLVSILSLMILASCGCMKNISYKDGIERRTDKFKINSIDSTEHYYIYKGLMLKDIEFVLVVNKNSRQLKCKNIELEKTYKFKTYDFWDIYVPTDSPMHYGVDKKLIWTQESGKDLRFTEFGM